MTVVEQARQTLAEGDRWSVKQFVAGALAMGLYILVGFAVPAAIVAASVGQASILWVAIPHMAFAALILGGILSAMFLMDAPDDAPPAACSATLPVSASLPRVGPAHLPSPNQPQRAGMSPIVGPFAH